MDMENVLGTNLFAYCLNNPVNMVDKEGLWAEKYAGFKLVKNIGFNVRMHINFLSRPFCRRFAKDVISREGSGWLIFRKLYGMDTVRIAAELFAHAVAYYAASAIKSVLNFVGLNLSVLDKIRKEAGDLNVNNNDKKAWAYYAVWYGAGMIRRFTPARYLPYFIL